MLCFESRVIVFSNLGFGKIYLAEKKDSGIYAIKRVNRKDDSNVATEIKVRSRIQFIPIFICYFFFFQS